LIDAFAAARTRDGRLKLMIVGTGATTELIDLVRARGLEAVTQIEEFVPADALNAAFNASDIGVWPRQPAITIQQAMASGLYVVLPQNDWVSHLLDERTGAYVSAQADVAEIAGAIETAASSFGAGAERRVRAETNQAFSGDALARLLLRDSALGD
jgi:glycosyltransferase involved in cell wall biosynthesis